MNPFICLDTEVNPQQKTLLDIGAVAEDGSTFHANSLNGLLDFICNRHFLCGHNIIHHDLPYLRPALDAAYKPNHFQLIDTLYLSPLLFPNRPYHALLKDDKLLTDSVNNPLNDALKAMDLFQDEFTAFHQLPDTLKEIHYLLLKNQVEFAGFFSYIGYSCPRTSVEELIKTFFKGEICASAPLGKLIKQSPREMAYCLALIHGGDIRSITPPWVLRNFPKVDRLITLLRNRPCLAGCAYCAQALDIHRGLKKFFGFDAYRKFGDEPLQESAVQAAVLQKSVLAVFPTGGGKSITFQVPALMSGESERGLTVVISPLQSLMKDQVDNLEASGITQAVAINGLLDPIERAKSFERVEDGSAALLYVSPESLRSRSIERLLLGRKISRFVIDEAHCFSSWGQDFRVDYLYIGDFIRDLQLKKQLTEPIPVSCFTATAKQKVIEDIQRYFLEKLGLHFTLFRSGVSRTNLHYSVFERREEEDKYSALRDLISAKACPTIVYVSRTRKAYDLAQRLNTDGFQARPYHGKMDKQEKSANQNAFVSGEVPIMVATSAFGMGVDKKDVGLVIHYEISDSLENYVQEAGRAGRDEAIEASCYVLFDEEDLSKHFIMLNQTKLSIKEIQQVWKAIKEVTHFRTTASNSALEIARKAGWDDSILDIETRVTTAIAALEDAGYLRRGQNMPRIFANSILSKNAQEAIDKIQASPRFNEKQKASGTRIIKKLFSSKSKLTDGEEAAESRVDYISDHLGIVREEVINIINLLREEKILADAKDLTAYIKQGEPINRSVSLVELYSKLEKFLLTQIGAEPAVHSLKALNEAAALTLGEEVTTHRIRTLITYWNIKHWAKSQLSRLSKNHLKVARLVDRELLEEKMEKRHVLSKFIIEYLYQKSRQLKELESNGEVLVAFSVQELRDAYLNHSALFLLDVSIADVEDTLYFLSKIEAIKIEGGFLVIYNRLTIERLEKDNKKRYKTEDYEKLREYYENKVQQIHIVGEYAKRMIQDYQGALQFVDDYFQLNYPSFLRKYFSASRQREIRQNITPAKFKQLFGELSPAQLAIIKDNRAQHILVAAGPGSGKTRVLVHKLASLLLMEDVRHEQLLMLTFSRAAATEFKKRLMDLIGNAALWVDIKTFHAYCFDILGKVGNLDASGDIIRQATQKINAGEVEIREVTRTVLVIDEAQDMNAEEFALIEALMAQNEEMRVIAVGDDDQNIYEFRGSSAAFLEEFLTKKQAIKYELVENYRSKANLVDFSNQWVAGLPKRLKSAPVIAKQSGNGKLSITTYMDQSLISPIVEDVLSSQLHGTVAVLTRTNEEAMQITGLLIKGGIPAKLIQSNDGFNLVNLYEVRYFLQQLRLPDDVFTIPPDNWKQAKDRLKEHFGKSTKFELCLQMISDFERIYPKTRYRSDLDTFIRESKLEDFFPQRTETVFVSTIHKAKGKEFDQVFIVLEKTPELTPEFRRLLYVGMTRAKQQLSIHLNGRFLAGFSAKNLTYKHNNQFTFPPQLLARQLTFRDIWLGYFLRRQHIIKRLRSGDPLTLREGECFDAAGHSVLKFSKSFLKELEVQSEKPYRIAQVRVNYLVYWKDEEHDREGLVILPELIFERISGS
ncbi:ATP-dependent DNA helicase RecQ [Lunatimonas lonarensis]|uniref:DNA 3'-5' helicase n=1 Tax=Lunatimonas lonarensis TaxID=1232681 RepID=R7ZTM2_9BACT|nr:RecQ family ATP-dependent DNA helicase [Lunatimonas lonarensis]EON77388.1 ATP-dependent DNA helicase RecQ [Lunatimonas lonarensis]